MKRFLFLIVLFLSAFLIGCGSGTQESTKKPNIVYILADDLGYGDVSFLNNDSKIKTAHIDSLARRGLTFVNAHSGSSVCTPTRYGILTGRYSWRSRLKEGVLWSNDPHLIEPGRATVASVLSERGYHTACVGKWHLGIDWATDSAGQINYLQPYANGPLSYGFDYFYGIPSSLDIPPYLFLEDNQTTATRVDTIQEQTGKGFWRTGPIGDDVDHTATLGHLADKAIGYIDERAKTNEPFFLYFPLTAPHTPILPTEEYRGKSNLNEYGDFVLMVDDVVGRLMAALRRHDLTDNTIVVFASDNGFAPMAGPEELLAKGHNPNFVFRGHKADIWEGGHHIPFIVHWPDQITSPRTVDETVSLTDFFATAAAVAGASYPDNAGEDSFNLLPLITGEGNFERAPVVVHSMNGSFGIIDDQWKLIFCPGSGGWDHTPRSEAEREGIPLLQLYDLKADMGEQHNRVLENPNETSRLTTSMEHLIANGRSTPGPVQANDGEISLAARE